MADVVELRKQLAAPWRSLDEHDRSRLVEALSARLARDFSPAAAVAGEELPWWLHLESGMTFVLVPGGCFEFGLSQREFAAAERIDGVRVRNTALWPPARAVEVAPMLVSVYPMHRHVAESRLSIDPELFRPAFLECENGVQPIWLSWSETVRLSRSFGFEIPSETQWEFFVRGGTTDLFGALGSTMPSEEQLENACSHDWRHPSAHRNGYGLRGLMFGEWCVDWFQEGESYVEERDFRYAGFRSVRGGAAALWPWQDCMEWYHMAPGVRMSSAELLDGTFGFRPVVSVERYL